MTRKTHELKFVSLGSVAGSFTLTFTNQNDDYRYCEAKLSPETLAFIVRHATEQLVKKATS
jgi:hypothetical protein